MRRNFRNGLAACAVVAGAMVPAAVCLGLPQRLPQWWQARRAEASLPARSLWRGEGLRPFCLPEAGMTLPVILRPGTGRRIRSPDGRDGFFAALRMTRRG